MLRVLTLSLVSLLFSPLWAQAEPEETYQEGLHYQVLPEPVRTRNPSQVEVVEVFWYGCHHCFNFEPMVEQWSKQLPENIHFWQSPAIWNKSMKIHAQAFYAAQALGVLEQIHTPFFAALNEQRQRLDDEDELAAFFARFGVADADFRKAFRSFGVNSQVMQAESRQRGYRIEGTPELIVNGRYRVAGKLAGNHENMLKIARYLADRELARLAGETAAAN